jgi:4-amino-4-deoxy-L-arabinose transferase-like glycosyltransferase
MTAKKRVTLQFGVEFLALLAAAGFIVMYVVVALKRLPYPFELEWMEGSMVDHVRRVLAGLPLYVPPSLDFVPFLYPPLYYWAAAAVAKLTGIGFEPLRLVSLVASLVTMFLMFVLVRRETGKWALGFLAAGLFAATYRNVGGWFDVARVDSLFLMLVFVAVCLIRCRETLLSWIFAGLVLAAAMLTKQVALAPAAALIAYGWFVNRRLALALSLSFALAALGSITGLTWASDGWFWYYAFAQPAAHKLAFSSAVYFLCRHVCFGMSIALLAAVVGLVWLRRDGDSKGFLFWSLLSAGMFAASALPAMKAGGWQNDLLPVYSALAMMLALTAHKLSALPVSALAWTAVLIQLAALVYHPSARLPTAADERAGRHLVAQLSAFNGDVLLFSHGFLSLRAGREPHANYIAVTDVLSSGSTRAREILIRDVRRALREKQFAAIVLDAKNDLDFAAAEFAASYRFERPVFEDAYVFWPVSGYPTRPECVYVPRSAGE